MPLIDTDTLPIGRALKVERVAAGVSQARVAATLGWTTSHLSHIESDRRHPSAATVERIRSAVKASAYE